LISKKEVGQINLQSIGKIKDVFIFDAVSLRLNLRDAFLPMKRTAVCIGGKNWFPAQKTFGVVFANCKTVLLYRSMILNQR
jgi:hypothetical protein